MEVMAVGAGVVQMMGVEVLVVLGVKEAMMVVRGVMSRELKNMSAKKFVHGYS